MVTITRFTLKPCNVTPRVYNHIWLSGGLPSPIRIKYTPSLKGLGKISADIRRLGGVGGVNVGIGGGGGEVNGNGGRAGDGTNGAEGVGVGGVAGNERGGGEGDGNVGRGGYGTNGAKGVVVGSCAKDELNKGLMMVSMVRRETRDAMCKWG